MTGKQTIELFLQKDKKRATKKSRQRRNALEQPNRQPGRDGDTRKMLYHRRNGNKNVRTTGEKVHCPPATTQLKAKEILRRSQLPREETTIVTLVRSECIGLRAFLYRC
jgi:hypothetical protein